MESTFGAKPRLVSGIKPTGRVHIGNYFGALRQFVALQDSYDAYIFIANLHALTATPSKEAMLADTYNMVLDYLAVGLDPEKVTLFKQSDVPAHANLAWVLDCLVPVPYLERAHAYKDAQAKAHEVNTGTFTYPVLMAADILLYDADVVPVGKDQIQHIEYARDIADKFNFRYSLNHEDLTEKYSNINQIDLSTKQKNGILKLPKELILEDVAVVPGTDGQKMSKSYNNTIPLFATDDEIAKAVMSIATDSRGRDEEKNPDELVLYQIHKLFNDTPELRAQYTQGLGYGDAKKMLIVDIISFVTPFREKRAYYEANPKLVDEILVKGAMKANDTAMAKLREVYTATGLIQ